MCKKCRNLPSLRRHSGRQHVRSVGVFIFLAFLGAFATSGPFFPAAAIFVSVSYLCLAVFEMAIRARKGCTDPNMISLPYRERCLIIIAVAFVLLVIMYADLYLWSCEVESSDVVMDGWVDAIYFSAVTMTTLGYGEFVPTGDLSKIIVLAQLFSGAVVFAAAFSAVISRSVG